ncbi:MAG: hypothetical protein J7L61_00250, partial [Thermoplasmata archaeon]|nr:hypothetical protein [Thermoplasmata archaeon]
MATPHISGVAALLWQAAPSLHISNLTDDNSLGGEEYRNDPYSRMHEVEVIMKLSAKYVPPARDNGVPDNYTIGNLGKPMDFAQGYGLVNVDLAVKIALTLEELRKTRPNATVLEAYNLSIGLNETIYQRGETASLETSWHGEWAQLSSKAGMIETDQRRFLYIPNETSKVYIDLQYAPVEVDQGFTYGQLGIEVDFGMDNSTDLSSTGGGVVEIDASSNAGQWWAVDVTGIGFSGWFRNNPTTQYREARVEYTVNVKAVLSSPDGAPVWVNVTDRQARVSQWDLAPPTGSNGTVIMLETRTYNVSSIYVEEEAPPPVKEEKSLLPLLLLLLLTVSAAAAILYWRRGRGKTSFP